MVLKFDEYINESYDMEVDDKMDIVLGYDEEEFEEDPERYFCYQIAAELWKLGKKPNSIINRSLVETACENLMGDNWEEQMEDVSFDDLLDNLEYHYGFKIR